MFKNFKFTPKPKKPASRPETSPVASAPDPYGHLRIRSASSSANLASLPPEMLTQILSHLPVASIRSLGAVNRVLREHCTSQSIAFAPWRRLYERHHAVFAKSHKEAREFAFQNRGKQNPTIAPTPPTQVLAGTQVGTRKRALEKAYEALLETLLTDMGLWPAPEAPTPPDTAPAIPRNLDQRAFAEMTTKSLFAALDTLATHNKRHLRLPDLHCSVDALVERLQRYLSLEIVEKLGPAQLGNLADIHPRAACYKLITAYLLYTELAPCDVLSVLQECAVGELLKEDQAQALTEYFSFLSMFIEMQIAQEELLRGDRTLEPSNEDRVEVFVGQSRRVLLGKLRLWLHYRFALPRPLSGPEESKSPTAGSKRTLSQPLPTPPSKKAKIWRTSTACQSTIADYFPSQPRLKLTPEQEDIVNFDVNAGDLVKVRAFAGTGKTRSLVEYAAARRHKRFLYVAFNKNAQTDASKKFGSHVECRTFHSVALGVMRHSAPAAHAAKLEIPQHGPHNSDYVELLGLDSEAEIRSALADPARHAHPKASRVHAPQLPFPSAVSVAQCVKKGFENYCNSSATEITDDILPKFLIDKVGLKKISIRRWVKKIWDAIMAGTNPWMTHDAYMKMLHLAGIPSEDSPSSCVSKADKAAFGKYDIILFDEAQDANPCIAEVLLRQRAHAALMIVGDPYQKIYGFRGAGNETFNDRAYPPTRTFYLTHSFRFGDEIAQVANTLLAVLGERVPINGVAKTDSVYRDLPRALDASPFNEPGTSRFTPYRHTRLHKSKVPQHTIIFRKNVTLIQAAIVYAVAFPSHRIYLRSSSPKKTLFQTLRAAKDLYHGTRVNYGVFKDFVSWYELKRHVEAEHEEASSNGSTIVESPMLALVVGLEKSIASETFLQDLAACEQNVVDESEKDTADVTLITAHQAKGLEWDRVEVAADFGPDYGKRERLSRGNRYSREEMNIMYVAVTRARKELIVSGAVLEWLAASFGTRRYYFSSTGDCSYCHQTDSQSPPDPADDRARTVFLCQESTMAPKNFSILLKDRSQAVVAPQKKRVIACLACLHFPASQHPTGLAVSSLGRALLIAGAAVGVGAWSAEGEIVEGTTSGASLAAASAWNPRVAERVAWDEGYEHYERAETSRVGWWVLQDEWRVETRIVDLIEGEEEEEGVEEMDVDEMDVDESDYGSDVDFDGDAIVVMNSFNAVGGARTVAVAESGAGRMPAGTRIETGPQTTGMFTQATPQMTGIFMGTQAAPIQISSDTEEEESGEAEEADEIEED